MNKKTLLPITSSATTSTLENVENLDSQVERVVRRRSFLKGLGMAGAALSAGTLLATDVQAEDGDRSGSLSKGDAAILRFLAAAEILETDLWVQYNELGGIQDSEVPGGSGSGPYTDALVALDGDMPQYIHDNTEDEHTHFRFINAYLASKGADTVNLDAFRTLPGSTATGSSRKPRLTNLMQLTVDTSFYTRYRSRTKNPDLDPNFWHDKAGAAVSAPIAPLTDPKNPTLMFPDLNSPPFGGENFQTNLIMPEPCPFLSRKFRVCSIIRPTKTEGLQWEQSRRLPRTGFSSANRRSSLKCCAIWQPTRMQHAGNVSQSNFQLPDYCRAADWQKSRTRGLKSPL